MTQLSESSSSSLRDTGPVWLTGGLAGLTNSIQPRRSVIIIIIAVVVVAAAGCRCCFRSADFVAEVRRPEELAAHLSPAAVAAAVNFTTPPSGRPELVRYKYIRRVMAMHQSQLLYFWRASPPPNTYCLFGCGVVPFTQSAQMAANNPRLNSRQLEGSHDELFGAGARWARSQIIVVAGWLAGLLARAGST